MNKSKFLKSDLEKTYYKNKMYKTSYRYNKFTKNKSIFSSMTRIFSSSLGGLPLLLIVLFLWFRYNDLATFLSKLFTKTEYSNNTKVNDSIQKLNVAIDQLGTDETLIFDVFNLLNTAEINLLFKDFGYREYNPTTGKYAIFNTYGIDSLSKKMNLKAILIEELNSYDLEILKSILHSKNVIF